MANPELFDFLTANAITHVGRDTGERVAASGPLPEYEGTYFIPGTASFGAMHQVGSLPGEPTREVSPDHRWVGLWEEEAFVLYDTRAGGERGFSFHPTFTEVQPHTIVIHPSGEMLALVNDDGISILLPDGKTLTQREFRAHKKHFSTPLFSVCGRYLWYLFAPASGPDCLLLLSVPTLEELDRIPVPRAPDTDDDDERYWTYSEAFLLPETNCLFIERESDDYVETLSLHRVTEEGKITTDHVERDSYPERVFGMGCSTDDQRIAATDRYSHIYQWSWPSCQLEYTKHLSDVSLLWGGHAECDYLAYNGDYLLFEYGEIVVVDATSFEFVGLLPSWREATYLDNGLLLLPDGPRRDMFALREPTEQKPAILEVDGQSGGIHRVYCRDDSGWRDHFEELSWVMPTFRLAYEGEEA